MERPAERLLVDKYAATANLQLGNFTLTSVTGYSRYSDRNLGDTDFQPGEYLSRGVDEVAS